MKKERNKMFYISYEKEIHDSQLLADMIKQDGWIDSSTIIVTCSPDYSSIPSQIVNHKLSHLNNNELFETKTFEMPYPVCSQIWNQDKEEYELYDRYAAKWVDKNIHISNKYLFLDSGTIRGKNFSKLHLLVRTKLEPDGYRFASLYVEENSIFVPHYYVQKYSDSINGGLIFQWENSDNPNWNY